MKLSTVLRICGSAVVALVLVFGVTSYIVMKTRRPANQAMMEVFKGIHVISLQQAKFLAGEDEKPRPKPKKPPAPPPMFPPRQVSGIVQVAFTVQPDGQATNVRVIGAAPAGYYEKQAKKIVASGYYKPTLAKDGTLKPREESTIIHFSVPAHQKAAPASAAPTE